MHNAADEISKFMEVPLGFCDAEVRDGGEFRKFNLTVKQTENLGEIGTFNIPQNGGQYTYGVNAPYYQWGRKDPFLPSNGMGNYDKPYYDNQYNPRAILTSTNINDVILHPNIVNTSSGNSSLELWNKNNTLTNVNSNKVYKTIYDPNPVGYIMPKISAFSGFTSNSGGYNQGYYFYSNHNGETVFFNALGIINPANGSVAQTDQGYYYSADPASSSECYFLRFFNGVITPTFVLTRALGFSVRPVLQ